MKKVALAMIGIFVFAALSSGCGKMSKKDFDTWKNPYVSKNAQEHSELGKQVATLSGKVDAQGSSLKSEIAAIKEAIDISEDGDTDTIKTTKQFARDEDAKLRAELIQAAEKAQKLAKEENEKTRVVVSDLEKQIKTQASELAKVQKSTPAGIETSRPALAAMVQFASGSSALTSAAKSELDKAISVIKNYPDATIVVRGHTDVTPLRKKSGDNWDLSQARAEVTVKYLKDKGVTNKITARALGYTEPIAPVKTEAGKARNRRAEVIVYPAGTMPAEMYTLNR